MLICMFGVCGKCRPSGSTCTVFMLINQSTRPECILWPVYSRFSIICCVCGVNPVSVCVTQVNKCTGRSPTVLLVEPVSIQCSTVQRKPELHDHVDLLTTLCRRPQCCEDCAASCVCTTAMYTASSYPVYSQCLIFNVLFDVPSCDQSVASCDAYCSVCLLIESAFVRPDVSPLDFL